MPITTPPATAFQIRWIASAVENLLHNHDILTRTELANTLGVARSTVYKAFDETWEGEPSMHMLATMAGYFRVPLNRLVTEPGRASVRRVNASANVRLAV